MLLQKLLDENKSEEKKQDLEHNSGKKAKRGSPSHQKPQVEGGSLISKTEMQENNSSDKTLEDS